MPEVQNIEDKLNNCTEREGRGICAFFFANCKTSVRPGLSAKTVQEVISHDHYYHLLMMMIMNHWSPIMVHPQNHDYECDHDNHDHHDRPHI